MLMAGQMHPPLSSSQSPLSSVSACGENCARSLAPPLPTARGAAGAPLGLAKRETGRARSKEKKRYGGSVCTSADLLPPAGDGWRSRAVVRDGNALPLGWLLAWGGQGYILRFFSLTLAAPCGSWCNGPMRVSAPTIAREARSEAERAERGAV